MSVRTSLWFALLTAAALAVLFAWFVRLPLPFPGFVVVVASGFAFLGTLTLTAWMPPSWVWSDAERLRHAFQERHGVSDTAAGSALDAVTRAHQRARILRDAARTMRDDAANSTVAIADRLDAAAREIFYEPKRQRALRSVLIRSELIEDAAKAHAALRRRSQETTEDESREKLLIAIKALDTAFDQTDLMAARGLLSEVEVASEVAEIVLKPRRTLDV